MALPVPFAPDAAAPPASPEEFGFALANLPLTTPSPYAGNRAHVSSSRASKMEVLENLTRQQEFAHQ
eukprot:8517443-Heterocapsa_arctica.AAC.1